MAETRITAGEFRGRVVHTPRGMAVRPTRSMVRASLFNILGDRVIDARVLDLYAGAGTLGFEALSRGADQVVFVDHDARSLGCIAATAAEFRCAERCDLVAAEVLRHLRRAGAELCRFDIAFLDAPYRDPELEQVLETLGEHPPALVVCEHHERRRIAETAGSLVRFRQVRHGLTTLSLFHPAAETTSA